MAVKSSGKTPTKPLTKSDKKGKVPNQVDPSDTLEVEAPPKKKRRIFKVLLVLLILLLLLGVGFGVGIYLKLFDIQKTAEDLNLQNSPIIGRFFQKPKTNFETTDLKPGEPVQPSPGNSLAETQAAANGQAAPNSPVPGVISDPNLAKLAKQRQQEENKKISKLARLYGEMKPSEAVPIMSKLDDQTIVKILSKMEEDQAAKVLAQFDASRAAQLSQSMLNAPTDINSANTPNAGAEVAPAANTP